MVSDKNEQVYQRIAKVSGIAIPLLYFFGGLISVAIFSLTGVMLVGSGDFKLESGTKLDLNSLSLTSRVIMAAAYVFTLACLVRFFWLLIQVAKRFKTREIFSEETAGYAHSAAFNLLVLHCGTLFIGAYGGILAGDLQIGMPPDGLVAIIFAYLFAWVLKIGSQLKAENDLTV